MLKMQWFNCLLQVYRLTLLTLLYLVVNMRRKKYKCVVWAIVLLSMYDFLGVSDYNGARSYDAEFDYPLNTDLRPLVKQVLTGKEPSVRPINFYPYRFLTNSGKCKNVDRLDIFIIVKSAMQNFGHRTAIRQTYGQENLIPGRVVKILFFLGTNKRKEEIQIEIEREMRDYKDIIQMDFHDTYYNNTIKTMMSFRWAYEHCRNADFYLFTDDDMYVSVTNLLNYVHDQKTGTFDKEENIIRKPKLVGDKQLFAGYVFNSAPLRYKISKWRVSLDDYPWDKWPTYVTAGAFVVSNKSLKQLYIGSFFVKHFKFDDVYLAIVAKKVGIVPTHCSRFHFYKKEYSLDGYKDVIASHGYEDHEELIRVWREQNYGSNFIEVEL